ncbi:nitroreductase family protein [Neolewinella antarctica]|uniref:Nitroreductase n=1 Tax=Neolewinella antarctica TaxID=442734 RepID=A0ABX0X9S2_9BACT|nr:nitroreductase family protein [Neolewinella antarctica]NJC26019.1 nitroreductase [Neolewinella antarctica]
MAANKEGFTRLTFTEHSPETMHLRSRQLYADLSQRRTVRKFSDRPVAKEIIENLIRTAATAPSGAHKQPWTFCVVSNPDMKASIREAAEKEEYENYHGRMSDDWLDDLKKFGTDWQKPFLTTAPYLIVVFKKSYDVGADGEREKNYYVNESVGLACGFLIAAIHHAGLVTVTHTPSPMNFLQQILGRPANERPFLLLPVGYPAEGVEVPVIERKSLRQVSVWFE